jgi:uncharacterized protein
MGEEEQPRTYPQGVPCWVDTGQADLQAASRFYGELFGWAFQDATPAGAPGTYLIAKSDGRDVAAIRTADQAPDWTTYIAIIDAGAGAAAVVAAGGTVVAEPRDAGPGGRTATCIDPGGAVFRLWQPRRRLGAQLVNVPHAWNFSHLHTSDEHSARAFYATVFGWRYDDVPGGASIRVPGYGNHLAATVDPGIYERQANAPAGFADVIGGLQLAGPDERPHWHVTFSVEDRETSAETAARLGATVLSTSESPWARFADIRDPQGAEFTISQFRPPS